MNIFNKQPSHTSVSHLSVGHYLLGASFLIAAATMFSKEINNTSYVLVDTGIGVVENVAKVVQGESRFSSMRWDI